jgi:transcriptional regulator with XRE-family HTH domain
MVHKPEKLEMATYYRKRGFSYSEIASICGVSKATVSNWLAAKKFSQQVKADNTAKAAKANKSRLALVNKARQAERTARYREAERSAAIEFRHYRKDPAFIGALLMYRAVGDLNHPTQLRVSSNDAELHRIFIKFACTYLGVQKEDIRCWLLLYENQSATVEVRWWSKKLKLPVARFGKSQVHSGHTDVLHNATGNTIIGSTVMKHKLKRWLELALKTV